MKVGIFLPTWRNLTQLRAVVHWKTSALTATSGDCGLPLRRGAGHGRQSVAEVHSTTTSGRDRKLDTRRSLTRDERERIHIYRTDVMPWKTNEDLLDHLCASIVYQNRDVLAIRKPYGMPHHQLKLHEYSPTAFPDRLSESDRGFSLQGLVGVLGKRLQFDLRRIFSPDRLFSGVALFAKGAEAEKRLKEYFKTCVIRKDQIYCFWAITHGVPRDLPKGVTSYHVARETGPDGVTKYVPVPRNQHSILRGDNIRSEISARVVDTNKSLGVALVKIMADRAKWDNLQLFLLDHKAPVLGDHQYSHRLKSFLGQTVARHDLNEEPYPQDLVLPIQDCLAIDGLDIRVPLHLHCGTVTLPSLRHLNDEAKDKQRGKKREKQRGNPDKTPAKPVSARPPGMFMFTLDALGLGKNVPEIGHWWEQAQPAAGSDVAHSVTGDGAESKEEMERDVEEGCHFRTLT